MVEFDGHKLDVRLHVRFADATGIVEDIDVNRVWLLVIIDVCSRAILGWNLVLAAEYNRNDVIRTGSSARASHEQRAAAALAPVSAPASRPPLSTSDPGHRRPEHAHHGRTGPAPSRGDKTTAIAYIEALLAAERPHLPVIVLRCRFRRVPSEIAFFSNFLHAVRHKAISGRDTELLRQRLVHRLCEIADARKSSQILPFADGAQDLGACECEWLRDVHDDLQHGTPLGLPSVHPSVPARSDRSREAVPSRCRRWPVAEVAALPRPLRLLVRRRHPLAPRRRRALPACRGPKGEPGVSGAQDAWSRSATRPDH